MKKILIKNGKVILEDRIEQADVLIEDGKFIKIGNIEEECSNVLDVHGLYVSPGFIDIHSHGGNGFDYMTGTLEAFKAATTLHMQHGATSIVPTTVAADINYTIEFLHKFDQLKENEEIPVRMLGVHLEGPYLALEQKGAIPAQYIKNPQKEEYLKILNASKNILRWTIAPELEGAYALGDELQNRGINASIGHSNAEDFQVHEAVQHGFRSVTHMYSMTSSIVRKNCYRHPGINEAAYLEDDLYIEAIADGHHLPDTLLRLMVKNKGYDKMILVTDSMSAAGFGDGLFYLGNPEDHHQVLIKNGVGFMPDMSSFAGSVACTDQLVRTMLKIGVPINQAVKMLSLNPAKLLHKDKELGSIAIGKRADLLIFDESIDMKYVFVDGDLRYKK
ncbi:MAG: N-acetylglucosamine-6-phosphate deacetylase [Acholeplasmatales bacterium]|nr:N-acetylglucosamine-6-phosphate deacetylase [Acholeplasmatales bacterium]